MRSKKKWNNKGSSLVTVIIAMAFVAILGSIVMTATLTNYRMKHNNLKTKESFYSAEQALDEIRIGLQETVSEAISEAYLEVLENYSSDLETKNQLMESKYFEAVWNKLQLGGDNKQYDTDILNSFLKETKWVDLAGGGGYGAIVSVADGKTKEMVAYKDTGVVLKNLEVYYRDQKGYVSIIRTDIKLAIPNLQFASSTALPDVTLYSIVADEGLELASLGTHIIEGSLYAGSIQASGSGDKGALKIDFKGDSPQLVSKEEISFQNATVTTAEGTQLWTKGILLNHADMLLAGQTNIADDLNITGSGNVVTIKGEYNGYGNSLTDPAKSSAILVNGNDTELNLKDTKVLTLAGHSYIGTGQKNLGEGGTQGEAEKKKNVVMGESIAVKGNQVLYLIPGECIGVKKSVENGNVIYGTSKFGRNPLTQEQYKEIAGRSDYAEIDEKTVVPKLGHSLSAYLKYEGTTPKPEKIFVQTNEETLIYYYMSFDSEEKANQFFRDYYGLNQERTDEYIDFYTNGITMPDPKVMLRLQLAGNVAKFDKTTKTGTLQENTITDASIKMKASAQTYGNMFDALCTKLVTNYSELTDLKESDLTKNIVFENIINVPDFKTFLAANAAFGVPDTYTFESAGSKAILTDNETSGLYTYKSDTDVHLIIASGDVRVESDFSGLIIANGTVTVKQGVSLKQNSEAVRNLLRAHTEIGGTVYNLIGFLWDGKEMLNMAGSMQGSSDESVRLSDLVIYENWSKN